MGSLPSARHWAGPCSRYRGNQHSLQGIQAPQGPGLTSVDLRVQAPDLRLSSTSPPTGCLLWGVSLLLLSLNILICTMGV